jgi:sec-independent protein translocase protein TatC
VCGTLLASPVIFLQIWRFVSPGLYRHEKRVLVPFMVISTLCFAGGALFGYFVVFPPAFRFLIGYSSDLLEAMPAVNEYFSLALRLFLAFAIVFELPVLMVFLAKVGVVDRPFLRRNRKYAVLISFVVAGPLVLLYEVSIIAVGLFARRPLTGFPGKGEADSGVTTTADNPPQD